MDQTLIIDYDVGINNVWNLNAAGVVQGFNNSVINVWDPSGGLPVSPNIGDKYLATASANGWIINRISYFDGESWIIIPVSDGTIIWNKALVGAYVWTGVAWIPFGGLPPVDYMYQLTVPPAIVANSVPVMGADNRHMAQTPVLIDPISGNATGLGTLTTSGTTLTIRTGAADMISFGQLAGGNLKIGYAALSSVTTGTSNLAIGNIALSAITTGSNNIAIGENTLKTNSGSRNVAIGSSALSNSIVASADSRNTAIGYEALNSIGLDSSAGSDNTAIGNWAGITLKGGNYNTFVGSNADVNADSAHTGVICIGYNAKADNQDCCQIGESALGTGVATMRFRTQTICDQAWIGGATTNIASITNTGDMTKSVVTIDGSGNLSGIGKITMSGIIDPPTGIAFSPQAANPAGAEAYAPNTLWFDTAANGPIRRGNANYVPQIAGVIADEMIPRFDGASSLMQPSSTTISDTGVITIASAIGGTPNLSISPGNPATLMYYNGTPNQTYLQIGDPTITLSSFGGVANIIGRNNLNAVSYDITMDGVGIILTAGYEPLPGINDRYIQIKGGQKITGFSDDVNLTSSSIVPTQNAVKKYVLERHVAIVAVGSADYAVPNTGYIDAPLHFSNIKYNFNIDMSVDSKFGVEYAGIYKITLNVVEAIGGAPLSAPIYAGIGPAYNQIQAETTVIGYAGASCFYSFQILVELVPNIGYYLYLKQDNAFAGANTAKSRICLIELINAYATT